VQVDVQVQGAAEPLDQGDNAGSGAAAGRESGPVGQIGLDRTDDDRETAAECIRPAGEEQAQWPGEAENPLTHRHFREDMVDQVRRRLDHPPCAAGRAEAPTLAGECDKVFVAAAVALHAHEPVLESATAQVILELGQHKAWQRGLVSLECMSQGWQMLLHYGIERRVLWLMALVGVACADGLVAGNSFHRTMMAGQGGLSQRSIAWRCVRHASQSHPASAV